KVVSGIVQTALGIEELVFCIEHIQKRTLANVELLLVCQPYFFGGCLVCHQEGHLLTQDLDAVPDHRQVLLQISACMVANVASSIRLGLRLTNSGAVGSAAIQVI